MLKQVFIGVLSVFILIVFTGCGGETKDERTVSSGIVPESSDQTEDADVLNLDEGSTAILLRDIKVNSTNIDDCNVFTVEAKKAKCEDNVYFNMAKADLNGDLCSKIREPLTKKQCQTYIEASESSKQALRGIIEVD